MEPNAENNCRRDAIKEKLRQNFDGKIVRKDLTKKIKEGANVPVYVLEFLLGQYCSSDDEAIIEKGVQNVKRILADNFVRPDEAQKILSQLRKKGSHTVIDMITVNLDIKKNCFFGLDKVPISDEYPEKYDRLLCGGIWCIVQLDYEVEGDNNFGLVDLGGEPLQSSQKKQKDLTPISIRKLTPIQMPHVDMDEVRNGRKAFTKEEWMGIYQDAKDYAVCFGVEPVTWKQAECVEQRQEEKYTNGEIYMAGGHMTVEQLVAMLNTIPIEITLVDKEDNNCFFNEGPKVFKRPTMAIGRPVFSCHPPKVEQQVRRIIGEFKAGTLDEVPIWMEKGGRCMYVKYMAVRNYKGEYLGTLELVQDMEFAKEYFTKKKQ